VVIGVSLALVGAVVSPARALEGAGGSPALRLVRVQPLTVAGSGFEPREAVRVRVVREDQTVARAVRASSTGGFVVSFPKLGLQRCAAVRVTAAGGRGSRAMLKLAQPACAPD